MKIILSTFVAEAHLQVSLKKQVGRFVYWFRALAVVVCLFICFGLVRQGLIL